jgi:hypothetical protein
MCNISVYGDERTGRGCVRKVHPSNNIKWREARKNKEKATNLAIVGSGS